MVKKKSLLVQPIGLVFPLSFLVLCMIRSVSAQSYVDAALVPIGLRKQLVVDDYVLDEKTHVTRELGSVVKANNGQPIIVVEKPWEDFSSCIIGSVFREAGKFKMYYKVGYGDPAPGDPPEKRPLRVAYAESTDGLHWTKPSLGVHVFQGGRDNNLIDPMGMQCFPDPHENDPRHKYKSAYTHWREIKASLAHSSDGLRWMPYNNGQPVTYRAADTINQLLWDESAKVYRLYTRTDYQDKLKAEIEVRGTRDMVNPDIKTDPTAWTTVREWCFNRNPQEYKRRQIYSLNGWIYEGVQFGLLWSLEYPGDRSEGPLDLDRRHERDVMNFYIVTARGDEMWNLEWVYADQPLIPRGPNGSFDKDWVQPAINVVTWNDQHWIYYVGQRERHGVPVPALNVRGAIGLATLRLDGFVGLTAGEQRGTILTKPLKLMGAGLEVNADASQGSLRIEVLDEARRAIPGYSNDDAAILKRCDSTRLRPTWGKN